MSARSNKPATRIPAAFLGVMLGVGLLGGCSWTPDWANPVEWYKGTRDWVAGEDAETKDARARDAEKQQNTQAGSAPNLATVPDRPKGMGQDTAKVQEGLVADRSQARHAALGPGDSSAGRVDPGSSASPAPSASAPPAPASAPPAPSMMESAPPPPPQSAAAEPAPTPPPAPPAPYAPAASSQPSSQASSSGLNPPPPPYPAAGGGDGVRDAYIAALEQSASTVTTAPAGLRDVTPITGQRSSMPMPPEPRGSVVLQPPPGVTPTTSGAVSFDGGSAVSMQVGTVLFGNGSSKLSKDDLQVIRNAAKMKKEKGGLVRVIGHASSRTRDVDPLRHRLVNFRLSLARANAVARQLIRLGVPANDVQVEARSDNDPVYYEFMPAGEAGNRRAEIYLDY